MINCNLHSGNQAWLASLRSNLITMFELMDFKHDGYIDFFEIDDMGIYTYEMTFKEIREMLEMEDINNGNDLNDLLLDLEDRKYSKHDIDQYLYSIIFG